MSKQLVLAEKPSVGRELARVLGCTTRERGYSEGEHYVVTWALGHLIELAEPAAYNNRYRRWSLEDLPMLPKTLKQTVMEQTADQYRVVESLLKRQDIETLIIATDAGREGELVARWIMRVAGWDKAVKRLWISSQTDAAIAQGFTKLKEGALYENLFAAAEARAAADWYVGLNVTRALTCRYDAKLSAGRVQTPTLALMTEREDEIEAFSGGFYWTIRADFNGFTASYQDVEGSIRIPSEKLANQIAEAIKDQTGTVVSIETTEKVEQPPLAYDLTELQRDANLQLSFSAKDTLDILQRLYEKYKIVTYPRTDSRYITPDIVPTLSGRLQALEATPFGQVATLYIDHGYRKDMDRFVMESGVTDHHAIIPTEQRVDIARLTKEERALWELIAIRFMEVLSGDYVYQSSLIEVQVAGYRFVTRTINPIRQGWRDMARLVGRRNNVTEEDLSEQPLENLSVEQPVTVGAIRTRRNTTNPPDRYTEATLLSAMEHAGRFVEDTLLKKRLGGGLGTSATRADIIEKLLQNYYIERDGKYLVPTPKGRELVRLAPPELCSPILTAQWEDRLAAIAEGKETQEEFLEDIKQNTKTLVFAVKANTEKFSPQFPNGKSCPYCSSPMQKATDEFGQVHFICQRLSCSYEEALVKRRITPPEVSAPAKKVAVRVKPMAASSASGKKIVVVKKSKKKVNLPTEQWETVVEVVQRSKLERRPSFTASSNTVQRKRNSSSAPRKEPRKPTPPKSDSGSTFADFLAASEKRKKERDKQKRK